MQQEPKVRSFCLLAISLSTVASNPYSTQASEVYQCMLSYSLIHFRTADFITYFPHALRSQCNLCIHVQQARQEAFQRSLGTPKRTRAPRSSCLLALYCPALLCLWDGDIAAHNKRCTSVYAAPVGAA
jgi:hypothetical protein